MDHLDLEELLSFRSVLNQEDYEMLIKSHTITKTLFVEGGAISSVGNSMNPWKNEVTVYTDCPGYQDVVQKIKDIDPDVTITTRTGWSLNPSARGFSIDSFSSGMAPAEFIFQQEGDGDRKRESIMHTALKTAEIGMIHHHG